MNRAAKNLASSSGELVVVLETLGLTLGKPVVLNDNLLGALDKSIVCGVTNWIFEISIALGTGLEVVALVVCTTF